MITTVMHLTSSSSNFKPFSLPKWDWKTQDQVSRQKKLSDLLCWEPVTTSLERTTPLETYWMVWNHRQKEFKLSWEHERFCTCVDTRWFLIVTKEGTVGAIYFLMIESWLYFYRISIIVHILIWHTQIRSQHYLWWQDSVFMDTARRSAFCASLRRCCGEEQRWIIIPIRCPWIQFEQAPLPPKHPTPSSPFGCWRERGMISLRKQVSIPPRKRAISSTASSLGPSWGGIAILKYQRMP